MMQDFSYCFGKNIQQCANCKRNINLYNIEKTEMLWFLNPEIKKRWFKTVCNNFILKR